MCITCYECYTFYMLDRIHSPEGVRICVRLCFAAVSSGCPAGTMVMVNLREGPKTEPLL